MKTSLYDTMIAFLLVVFLAAAVAGNALLISFNNSLLNPAFYQKQMLDRDVSGRVINAFTSMTVQMVRQAGFLPLPEAQLNSLVVSFLPPQWVVDETSKLTNEIMNFANLKSTSLDFSVNLVPIKETFQRTEWVSTVDKMLSELPACSEEELIRFQIAITSQSSSLEALPFCQPPEFFRGQAIIFLSNEISRVVSGLPDELVLAAPDQLTAVTRSPEFRLWRLSVGLLRISPFVTAGLVFLSILLYSRKPEKFLRLFGWSFLASGILFSIAYLLVRAALALIAGNLNSLQTGNLLSTGLTDSLAGLITAAADSFSGFSLIVMGVLFLTGTIWLVISKMFKKPAAVYLSSGRSR